MRGPVLLGFVIVEIIYLILGGLIFWALESHREQAQKTAQRNFNLPGLLHNLTVTYPCISLENLTDISNQIIDFERSGLLQSKESNDWDIHGSIFFAMTAVTTIGYGSVTPSTTGGQLFCVLFVMIGIPVTMVMLMGIGDLLKTVSARINWRVGENRPKLHKFIHTVAMTVVGVVMFLLIPAAIFVQLEDWSYGAAVYYGVITATTVGFGDYVAAWTCVGDYCWIYRISVGIWIFFGLAWLAGVIGAIQDGLQLLISKSDSASEKSSDDEKKEKHDDSDGVGEGEAHGCGDVTSLVPLKPIASSQTETSLKGDDVNV